MADNCRLRRKRFPLTTLGIIVIVIFSVLTIIFVYWLFLYFKLPSHIKNIDTLVNTSITAVIEEQYSNNYCPTRQEVLQITSNVFYGLHRKGFEKTEDAKDTIQQAIRLEILQGDGPSLYLERPATKQESLVFIGRSLGITEHVDSETPPDFSDLTSFDDWAKPQINGLVSQGYLITSEIDILYNLHDIITISELEHVLDQVVDSLTRPISFIDFIRSIEINSHILSGLKQILFTATPAVIAIVSTIIALLKYKKKFDEKKKQKARRTGTICLAGTTSVGKSTLKIKMKDPSTSVYELETQMQPTRTSNSDRIVIRSYQGEVVFEGPIIDVPGQKPEEVLQFLMSDHPNKILLLVLAHTKAYVGDIDSDFVQEQLNEIQSLWATTIRACKNNLSKIVILINKIDLLPSESLPAEKYIYREHIKLLFEAAKTGHIPIRVVEASSTTGKSLNYLFQVLYPNPN